jgi:hypothetical protein
MALSTITLTLKFSSGLYIEGFKGTHAGLYESLMFISNTKYMYNITAVSL